MSLEFLTMKITYQIKDGQFSISGNLGDKNFQSELIGRFLMEEIGKGADNTKPNEQDIYNITFKWYPENDLIEVTSDTGNKGLRDGILMDVLKRYF